MTPAQTFEHYPEKEGSFLDALLIQKRVIGALILREVKTRFWKNKMGYLWIVVEPSLHVIILSCIAYYIRDLKTVLGITPVEVIGTGIVPFFLFRNVSVFIGASIVANQSLLKYPLVKIIDLIIARFTLESLTEMVGGSIVMAALLGLNLMALPRDPVGLIAPCAALLLMALGVGTCFAVWQALSNTAWTFIVLGLMVVFMTSGIFFTGASLPPQAIQYLAWNPIFDCLTLFRESYFYSFHFPNISIWYPLAFGAGTWLLGLSMLRVARSRLKEL